MLVFVGFLASSLLGQGRDGNFAACLAGHYCNKSLLSPDVAARVHQADVARNNTACLAGHYCNKSLLSPDVAGRVHQADVARNNTACLAGHYCNKSLLAPDVAAQLHQADVARNNAACLTGHYCNKSLLAPDVAAEVLRANIARNNAACLAGHYCNKSLLAPDVALDVQRARQTPPAAAFVFSNSVPDTRTLPGPSVSDTLTADNGSYYGEPNANGVPKTVHVNGYYRRDGTYVRGHYRSTPYSNPPSSRSRRR